MKWIDKLFEKYWVALCILLIGFFVLINNVFENTTIGLVGSFILTALTLHLKHRYVLYSVLGIIWILAIVFIFKET